MFRLGLAIFRVIQTQKNVYQPDSMSLSTMQQKQVLRPCSKVRAIQTYKFVSLCWNCECNSLMNNMKYYNSFLLKGLFLICYCL